MRRRNFAPSQLREVTAPVDPRVLPAGTYVASSLKGGYGALWSAVTLNYARFGGQHISPRGVKELLATVGPTLNPQIGIAREFFTTVLRDYRDWRIKWWREAIQNAVDAGATKVKCEVVQLEDRTWRISCDDNGRGMDRATLVDKFLMLGATTKVGAAGVGGFGKAKELLILPWLKWKVHTLDYMAEGVGVQYEVRQVQRRAGTRLEVLMPADEYTYAAAAIAFLEKCDLPNTSFEVISKPQTEEHERKRPKAKMEGRSLLGTVPGKAEIYVTKVKYQANSIYVRVNGMFMFSNYIGETGDKQILVEITAPSVEVLTANRDGFRDWEVSDAVSKLAERVAKDTKSALAMKSGLIRKKYTGKGKFKTEQLQAAALGQVGPIPMTSKGRVNLPQPDAIAIAQVVERMLRTGLPAEGGAPAVGSLPNRALSQEFMSIPFSGAHHVEQAVRQLVWEPDFYMINEVEGRRVPKKFMPESMTPTILKLAKVWTELCRFVLIQLGAFHEFGVGFVISEDAMAMYKPEDDEHWLLLNPYTSPRSLKDVWKPSNREHQKHLYALAVHECTHLADGLEYHDESFASALTHNIAKTADGFRKVGKIVSEIKMKGDPELEAEAARMAMNPGRRRRL